MLIKKTTTELCSISTKLGCSCLITTLAFTVALDQTNIRFMASFDHYVLEITHSSVILNMMWSSCPLIIRDALTAVQFLGIVSLPAYLLIVLTLSLQSADFSLLPEEENTGAVCSVDMDAVAQKIMSMMIKSRLLRDRNNCIILLTQLSSSQAQTAS